MSELEANVVRPTLTAIGVFMEDAYNVLESSGWDREVVDNMMELKWQLLEAAHTLVRPAVEEQGLGVGEVPSLRLLPAILTTTFATISQVPASHAEAGDQVRHTAEAVQAVFLKASRGSGGRRSSSSESEVQEVSLQEVSLPLHNTFRGSVGRTSKSGSSSRRSRGRSGSSSRSRSGSRRSSRRSGSRRNRRSGSRRIRRSGSRRRRRSRSPGGAKEEARRSRVRLTKEEKEELAEDIAQRVFRMKEEKEVRDKYEARRSDVWEKGRDFLICKACSTYKDQTNLPKEILKLKRGVTGMVARNRDNGRKIPEGEVRRRVNEHEEKNFHLWCVRKAQEEKKSSKTYEEENKEAGLLVIKAFLKTASEGGSGQDFLRLVDFTHLIPGVVKSQKNNSRPAFFKLRDDCFELVTERVKERFRSGAINEISITLDKVTVQSRSFTVLLTFFFSNGKIYCLLNGLLKMGRKDYDSAGTAEMIVDSLKETLGLTSSQLARKLLHAR